MFKGSLPDRTNLFPPVRSDRRGRSSFGGKTSKIPDCGAPRGFALWKLLAPGLLGGTTSYWPVAILGIGEPTVKPARD